MEARAPTRRVGRKFWLAVALVGILVSAGLAVGLYRGSGTAHLGVNIISRYESVSVTYRLYANYDTNRYVSEADLVRSDTIGPGLNHGTFVFDRVVEGGPVQCSRVQVLVVTEPSGSGPYGRDVCLRPGSNEIVEVEQRP